MIHASCFHNWPLRFIFPNYFRELSSTFIKLCDIVDAAKKKVENEISKLSDEIADLEKAESQARILGLV